MLASAQIDTIRRAIGLPKSRPARGQRGVLDSLSAPSQAEATMRRDHKTVTVAAGEETPFVRLGGPENVATKIVISPEHAALVLVALEHWNIVKEEWVVAATFARFPRIVPAGAPMRIRFKNNGPMELTSPSSSGSSAARHLHGVVAMPNDLAGGG
jgi:hypothetical protein